MCWARMRGRWVKKEWRGAVVCQLVIKTKNPFHVTVNICSRADGMSIVPPQIIHQDIIRTPAKTIFLPSDWGLEVNEHGGSDFDTFYHWCQLFVNSIPKATKEKPVFLFLDGHGSRWSKAA